MAKFTHYEACPQCQANGQDSRGDNLAIYADGGAHCFSCKYHHFPKSYVSPVKEESHGEKSVLPADFSREIPTAAWQWLLQYGLSWKYWTPYTGYSAKEERLVITVGDPIQFSIGRYVGETPTTNTKRKWYIWGNAHQQPHVIGDYSESKCVVLVEDIVSAHKIGQVGTAIPLFGTDIFPSLIPALRHINLPILMWLDKDQEQYAMKRGARLSVLTGLPVRYIFTDDDPKLQTFDFITKVVKNYD